MSYTNVLKGSLAPELLEEDKSVEGYSLNVKNVAIIDSKDTFRQPERPHNPENVTPEMKSGK